MKKMLILVSFLLTFVGLCFAQTTIEWQRCYGGSNSDNGSSIQQTCDGGYIISGNSNSNDGDVSGHHGITDCWIVKIDSLGSIEWQRCYGGSNRDYGSSIQQTCDGGYIISGNSNSNDGDVSGNHGYTDCWIVKIDSLGSIEWQRCLGGSNIDEAFSVQQTHDKGYIVAGHTFSNDGDVSGNHGAYDLWMVKIDSLGSIEWQRCLGGSNHDYGSSIQQTRDGGYIISGSSNSNDGDVSGNHGYTDCWIVKIDSLGLIEWQRCYGGSDIDKASSVQQTYDKGYIVAGYTFSNDGDVNGNHGYTDYWLLKLNSSGSIEWQRCYGGSHSEFMQSIRQTTDNGYIVIGYTGSNDGDVSGNHGHSDYWLLKLNSSGSIEWQRCLGGYGEDFAYSVQQVADNNYIITGYSGSVNGDVSGNHGNSDCWIVKLSSETGIIQNIKPQKFSVNTCPNPFNSSIYISYSIPTNQGISIDIYNVSGRKIKAFKNANQQGQIVWNATDQNGQLVPSGIYYAEIQTGNTTTSRKLVLIK
ncbi:MAG: T9SS type A sorting domain-containing protein [Patescibacteria group bacterium]|nr:T9SS type A sorting domain-containing protein [Patescibacteria group bacterium]